jgi:penicillin amidase
MSAASALADAIDAPASHPELASVLAQASAQAKPLVRPALMLLQKWSGDTPSGVAESNPTAQQIADSQAAVVMGVWLRTFTDRTLRDEEAVLGITRGTVARLKLMVRLCTHTEQLATAIAPATGDPILFDDLTTKSETEGKLQMAALGLLDALDIIAGKMGADPSRWRWGTIHTVSLAPIGGQTGLTLPKPSDPQYANGWPRPGAWGTVDPAAEVLDLQNYSYTDGPVIRFVAELDPQKGPHARNVMPGGEIFDPSSPHYGDMAELWRKNQAFDLAYQPVDVAASAKKELAQNHVDIVGRVTFAPR